MVRLQGGFGLLKYPARHRQPHEIHMAAEPGGADRPTARGARQQGATAESGARATHQG